jgi:hypothetical protein
LIADAASADLPQNYARLRAVGIRTLRESIGWSRAERDRDALCDGVPDDVRRSAQRLRTLALRTVSIGFTGRQGLWEIGRCAAVLSSACDAALAARHATGRACEARLSI